ncbi:fec operon regulator FecR [compost metagenome]
MVVRENTELSKSGIREKYAQHINTENDWKLVQNRVAIRSHYRIISISKRLIRYAAILSIPLAIGITFYFSVKHGDKSTPPPPSTIAAEIHKNKPFLILDDGSQIMLTEEINGRIKGTQVMSMNEILDYSEVNPDKVAFNTLIVPKGDTHKIILEDGTEVFLNADSRLKFRVSFANVHQREVFLESGEAYFNVTQNPEKPFIVHHGNMSVKVLGTSFNVNAYTATVQTTLVEGKVKVDFNNSTKGLTLAPGQQALFDSIHETLEKQTVEVDSYVVWKEGVFALDHASLETLMAQVGRAYDLDIEFKDATLKQLHFSGRVTKSEDVKEVLDVIKKTTHLKFTIKDRRIIIEKSVR